jgi:hypothetical protein
MELRELIKNSIKEYLNEQQEQDSDSDNRKKVQLDIILKTNPMLDDNHLGIRTLNDIKTAKEAWDTNVDFNEDFVYPDFSQQDAKKALSSGKIKIYSSYPIKHGTFITPSKRMATDYAGGKEPYSKVVGINDVAWINADEGMFAKIK